MIEQDTGQREARGGLFFFTKRLMLTIYKQCAYILELELCVRGGLLDHNISVILHYFLHFLCAFGCSLRSRQSCRRFFLL